MVGSSRCPHRYRDSPPWPGHVRSPIDCFTGTFLLKKITRIRQTANYLYIFHSSLKHLPKVRSRRLNHSDKCFFHVFCHVVLQRKCRKNGYSLIHRLFLLISNICGTYQGILNLKTSRNISLE